MEVANAGTPTDPLALEPLVGTDPPARVDPLLDELEASLVARPSQAAQMEPPSLLHLLQLSFADAAAPEVEHHPWRASTTMLRLRDRITPTTYWRTHPAAPLVTLSTPRLKLSPPHLLMGMWTTRRPW